MKYLAPVISLFIILVCTIWCFNLRNPHLLPIRSYETWIIITLLLTLFGITHKIRNKYLKKAQIATAVILSLYVLVSEGQFYLLKQQILHSPSIKERIINQRIIVGFSDFDGLEILAKNGIAGIFLTKRNIINTSKDELISKINNLQTLRLQFGLPPLFITTDQEGGPVSRLSPLIETQPPLSKLTVEEDAVNLAFEYGKKQGRQLHALGVNINFSPVVDLKPSQKSGILDFHTMIHSRAISENPKDTTAIAEAYIKGLNATGVTATLKHFPGLMRVRKDTHHFSAYLDTDIAVLEKSDWLPFAQATKETDTWIMLSHVVLSKVDPINPVSTSQTVVNEILRKKLKFDGVLITDDLTMGATYNRGFCKSVIDSYNSDINYLLISYDYEKYFDALDCITTHEGKS